MRTVEVSLALPLNQTFTYRVPEEINISYGSRVLVPFGKRKKVGIVISFTNQNVPSKYQLKTIEKVLDESPLISEKYLEWLTWAASYYMAPLGEVFSTALPSSFFDVTRVQKKKAAKTRSSPLAGHWINEKVIHLNDEQNEIVQELIKCSSSSPSPALLHGITGSGKTEVYIRFMENLVNQGREVIYLVPEIGLTPQVIGRLSSVFGDKLALYHSGLTENQRVKEWLRTKNGEAKVMVGTRSALFAPFNNLGAIIIDEEHDASYKQEETFRYHARDLALVRGKIDHCVVLMGSATPALETYQHALTGKYRYFQLKNRATSAVLPKIEIVDVAKQKRQTHSPLVLCQEIIKGIERNLQEGEQTLLLMNRRGFARSFFCLACEKALQCPNCSVNLIHHRRSKSPGGTLVCHYCDYEIPMPKECPDCKQREVTLLGSGTETLEDEIKTYFPKARVARLDRDTIQKKGVLLGTLKKLREGEIDILVGTQMIAKGHDIPNVTLVGVVGIDNGLGIPDFRASERTFQLLTQVSGRAGRGRKPGRVIVQTYSPDHAAIRFACAHDYQSFFDEEIKWRTELGYPPVGRLVQIRWGSVNEKKIERFITHQIAGFIKSITPQGGRFTEGVEILGPAPTPLAKVRGEYRWHILLKGKTPSSLKEAVKKIMVYNEQSKEGIRCVVDIDPIGML